MDKGTELTGKIGHVNKDNIEVFEALDKLEECANGMQDLPKSNWIDLAEDQAELDLKIMDWVETIKFELFKGKQAIKELKAIKKAKQGEALKGLEYICKILNEKRIDIKWLFKEEYNTIKQVLLKAQEQDKVLEIIKEKRVDLCILTDCDNVNEYNKSLGNFRPVEDRLTYEEFALLKRWNNG